MKILHGRESATTLVFAGHEGPVDAGDADAYAVDAIAEHDEAMAIGAEPGIVGSLWRGGSHEDVFAAHAAFELREFGAVTGRFFVRHGRFVGKESTAGHVAAVSGGGVAEFFFDAQGGQSNDRALEVDDRGERFHATIAPCAVICIVFFDFGELCVFDFRGFESG